MKGKNACLVFNPRAGQNLAKMADILIVLSAAGWSTDIALQRHGETIIVEGKKNKRGVIRAKEIVL